MHAREAARDAGGDELAFRRERDHVCTATGDDSAMAVCTSNHRGWIRGGQTRHGGERRVREGGEVAHRVNLKFAPELRFHIDDRFDEAERIEKLLRTPEVQRDLAPDSDEE